MVLSGPLKTISFYVNLFKTLHFFSESSPYLYFHNGKAYPFKYK